jgi:hypothetical protein
MFVRKPSETVTGEAAAALALEVVPLELAVLDADDEQPASSKAAPTIAAAVTRRIPLS